MNPPTARQPLYRITYTAFSLLAILAMVGCGTPSGRQSSSAEPTLQANPSLHVGNMHLLFKPSEWKQLANRRYTGYVIMRGHIETDGLVSGPYVVEAWPDRSRDSLAIEFCDDIRIKAVTIGSRVRPTARVCVVFYEFPPLKSALVFGQQDDTIAPTGVDKTLQQVLIKSY